MESYFASPERSTDVELQQEVACLEDNSVIDGLMNLVSGLLAVLNEHRQIVALNTSFLNMIGIHDPGEVLGLRVGESIKCIHAHEMPAGCGTTDFCSSCGAAIAMVAALKDNRAQERECAVTVERDNRQMDIYFKVRAMPVTIEQERFILLFLSDITQQQQWASLERVFFHDMNNILFALLGRCELMVDEEDKDTAAMQIYDLAMRLSREVEIQRCLLHEGLATYRPLMRPVTLGEVVAELRQTFSNHAAAKTKTVIYPELAGIVEFSTDLSLLLRILENMVLNALEATDDGGQVEVNFKHNKNRIAFSVWNAQEIPASVRKRVFQRNVTTKEGLGRGLGAYSVKLFGEQALGGKVDFTTDADVGTTFRLTLPLN